jgi:hypothetical protein
MAVPRGDQPSSPRSPSGAGLNAIAGAVASGSRVGEAFDAEPGTAAPVDCGVGPGAGVGAAVGEGAASGGGAVGRASAFRLAGGDGAAAGARAALGGVAGTGGAFASVGGRDNGVGFPA